ncbi:MAG TPA: TIGR03118 family protein [Bryobacteraceae bacterium]|nr:TIGR03118 family protein [Bryobacteraceae bacterium]
MIPLLLSMAAGAQDTTTNSYLQTSLVSDLSTVAPVTDAHLKNPWGLSRTANSFWWAADNGAGVSTLYDGSGAVQTLVVKIPPASGTGKGSPTGTVTVGSKFVFVTLDGTVQEWSSGKIAAIKVNNSTKGASYTGVTMAKNGTALTLYVANRNGGVETYDATTFLPITLGAGAFTDPAIPAGYTPYGIQSVGAKVYVTFSNPTTAVGGYVDAFNTAGTLLLSLKTGTAGKFDQPWGIAQAPTGWGVFGNDILIGNVGSGWIGAYSATTGAFKGFLKNSSGQDITIPGLWAIHFGGGTVNNGNTTSLYFAAGINNYADGLFGTITPN